MLRVLQLEGPMDTAMLEAAEQNDVNILGVHVGRPILFSVSVSVSASASASGVQEGQEGLVGNLSDFVSVSDSASAATEPVGAMSWFACVLQQEHRGNRASEPYPANDAK